MSNAHVQKRTKFDHYLKFLFLIHVLKEKFINFVLYNKEMDIQLP